ncbi:hypothetical protein SARC_05133 [Sphaeroforma arctica JP610]|uniref:Uncharacterized protein n=1 Tax=Sphaeroforma arctica JP610 TaxID=667725 RepID=A0A0L0G0G5_9EUKA|nr:hypothetical protein SARC_05133 [Sphaeroforma arctica JP610]KNC82582.1 hypothetical protein SARC_05133 [Sphaeroforma arctica JP610]|eukprot:XP_014156484.1 hypothetical protein SARC_05133 [Sphaeroforma arctica JP610]
MVRKLRRLVTHAITTEEQVSSEPIPTPPTQERARLYCELGEEVYSTLILVAKQFARVPENNQKKGSIRIGKSNQDSQSNDGTRRGMTKSPKSSLIRCCAPCAHEHNTQNFELRQKVENIRCIISKLSNTQPLTRQCTHTYGAPLKCNSMSQIHEGKSHISQSLGLSPLEFAPLKYAKEWAQPGPVLLNACQEQADDVYNGMVINMGIIVLKVMKYAAQLDHADQKGICTLAHHAHNAAHDTVGVTI